MAANRHEADDRRLPEPNVWSGLDEEQGEPVAEAQYRTGQNVYHRKFGDGVVIESKLTGNDEEVVVAFENKEYGIKRLVASLARLERRE